MNAASTLKLFVPCCVDVIKVVLEGTYVYIISCLYCMTVLNNLISHPLVSTADQPTYHGVVIVVHNERYLKDPGN